MLLMQTILLKPKGIERCQILSVRDTVSKHTNSLTGWFKEIEIFQNIKTYLDMIGHIIGYEELNHVIIFECEY